MANFFVTIVPNLKLKSGSHTIRIAVTHSGQTRYIPTNVVIDNESEFKNGKIIKHRNKLQKPFECIQLDAKGNVLNKTEVASAYTKVKVLNEKVATICLKGTAEIFEIVPTTEY